MSFNTPDPASVSRQDVEFPSGDVLCRGWLTYPAGAASRPVPLILMAHGFGGTREHGLEPYARRFNAAGYATLIFDYRTFGASEGEPRGNVDWKAEVADWHAALAYARTLQGVDVSRIVLWGTSFAGGLVVSVAAQDHAVVAIVSQCPMLDGLSASMEKARYDGLGPLLLTGIHGMRDVFRALFVLSAYYVPAAATPGQVAAMTSADALPGYQRITNHASNQVTARSLLRVSDCRPIKDATRVTCPALIQICDKDTVAPPKDAAKAATLMPKAEAIHYPYGHFEIYVDDAFEVSVTDQLRFLNQHVVAG